jgi:hypothetical protein
MILVSADNWFYGKDIIIDVISVLVLLFILIYSARYYALNKKEKKYALLIASFSTLTISFLAKILSHFIIYYRDTGVKQMGVITVTYQTISQSYALIFWGLLAYRILSIIGLYLFYLIYTEKTSKLNLFITAYLLVLSGYLGHIEYALYHITFSLVLLAVILRLSARYKEKNYHTTKLLIYGFSMILLSQICFILTLYYLQSYMAGEIIQLAGYSLVLLSFLKVTRFGPKKKRTA